MIDAYADGAGKLRQSIQGLTRDDLVAFPVPGTWSIQQIVLHLMDSDLILADRMKRVIAEDNPTLIGFDESRFVRSLHYDAQPAEDAAALFELNRRMFGHVLRQLPPEAFDRVGTHNERGTLKLYDLLTMAVRHLDHHLKFVRDKREKLGKLMW
jgi:hypothetical protein